MSSTAALGQQQQRDQDYWLPGIQLRVSRLTIYAFPCGRANLLKKHKKIISVKC